MRRFEVTEGENFETTLKDLRLKSREEEELREALDWKLSRSPESGEKVGTLFYESYLLRPGKYLLIAYRVESEMVILEEVHKDLSQDF